MSSRKQRATAMAMEAQAEKGQMGKLPQLRCYLTPLRMPANGQQKPYWTRGTHRCRHVERPKPESSPTISITHGNRGDAVKTKDYAGPVRSKSESGTHHSSHPVKTAHAGNQGHHIISIDVISAAEDFDYFSPCSSLRLNQALGGYY